MGAWKALVVSSRANVWSALAGIPVAWGFAFCLQLVLSLGLSALNSIGLLPDSVLKTENPAAWIAGTFIFNAWLNPGYRFSTLHWSIPLAALALCIPAYWISVRFEYSAAKGMFEEDRWEEVRRWVVLANRCSYSMIAVILLGITVYNLWLHGLKVPEW